MAENDIKKEGDEGFEEWCNTNLADESSALVNEGQPVATEAFMDLTNLEQVPTSENAGVPFDFDPNADQIVPTYTSEEVAKMISSGEIGDIRASVQCLIKAADESITYCGMLYDKAFIMRKPKDAGDSRVVVSDIIKRVISVCLDYKENTDDAGQVMFDTITLGVIGETLCVTRYDYDFNVVKSSGIADMAFFNNVSTINKINDKFIIGGSVIDTETGKNVQMLLIVSDDFLESQIIMLRHDIPESFNAMHLDMEVRSVFLADTDVIVFGAVVNDLEQCFITLSQLDSTMQPGRFATVNVGDNFKTVGSYAWYNEIENVISLVGFYVDEEGKSVPFNASFDRQLNHIKESVS